MNAKHWLNPTRLLAIYAWIFSLFILWGSVRTAINPAPHGLPVQLLAAIEIGGALLFPFSKTRRIGVVILIGVFAAAAGIEVHLHEWPVRFVFYAATALLVQFLSNFSSDGAAQSA